VGRDRDAHLIRDLEPAAALERLVVHEHLNQAQETLALLVRQAVRQGHVARDDLSPPLWNRLRAQPNRAVPPPADEWQSRARDDERGAHE